MHGSQGKLSWIAGLRCPQVDFGIEFAKSAAPKTTIPKTRATFPSGSWDCLRAAVANGADAVFFGMPRFNARMRAENFREEELGDVMAFLHSHGVKGFVTLNVLIFPDELDAAVAELRLLNDSGVDAVIIQDVGLAEISRRMFPALQVHASTQMTITFPEGVVFAEQLGVKQVVLSARVVAAGVREIRQPVAAGGLRAWRALRGVLRAVPHK